MKKNKSLPQQTWLQRTSTMVMVFGLLLFTGLLLLTVIISNQSIQESQDLREQASVDEGKVNITASYPQEIRVGQPLEIELKANTGGLQTDGLELIFDIITQVTDQVELYSVNPQLSNLQTEVKRVNHGFSAEMILTIHPDRPFSSTTPETVALIKMVPNKSGSIEINFDTEDSIAPVHNTDPVKDELTHVSPINIMVYKESEADGEDNFYAYDDNLSDRFEFYEIDDSDQQVDRDDLEVGNVYIVKHTVKVNNLKYDSRSSDPTPIITELSAADSGVAKSNLSYSTFLRSEDDTTIDLETSFVAQAGDNNFEVTLDADDAVDESDEDDNDYRYTINLQGDSTQSETCNESCDSNSDCSVNERCYDTGDDGDRCRLASNVTSAICAGPDDQGLSKQCNEYCADTNECASGLVCWYNQCRNPYNVDNSACPTPSTAQMQQIKDGCNQLCSANADCANNLACYKGSCRLATNVSSTSCTAATVVRTSGSSNTNVGMGTTSSKPQATPNLNATSSAKPSPSVAPTPIPTRVPTTTDSTGDNVTSDESVLDAIMGSVMGAFNSAADSVSSLMGNGSDQSSDVGQSRNLMSYLPIAIIILGVVMIIVVILKFVGGILARNRDEAVSSGPTRPSETSRPPAQWHPAQKPPQVHGHGMTAPPNASINDRGSVSGGINNPQEIELPSNSENTNN